MDVVGDAGLSAVPAGARPAVGVAPGDGFEAWYLAHHGELVGTLTWVAGDVDAAADAADEAFARAWARWRRVSAMPSPMGWTYRVALNVVRRRMRRAAHEARLLDGTPPPPAALPGTAVELWSVVATLPERQRVAVALRYVADLPEAEVARVMGVRAGTVASTLSAARRRLARALEDDDGR